jgi:hypothetical protein
MLAAAQNLGLTLHPLSVNLAGAGYGARKATAACYRGALASGFATAALHHHSGHDHTGCACWLGLRVRTRRIGRLIWSTAGLRP